MKKPTKDSTAKPKLTPKYLKDFIPSSYPNQRDNNPVLPPNQSNKDYHPDISPREIPKEWNDQEVISSFQPKAELTQSNPTPEPNQHKDSTIQVTVQVYSDPQCNLIYLPHSLYNDYLNNEVKWSRPEEYFKENQIDKEIIAHFPNKNKFKFKTKIKDMYAEEKERRESGKPIEVSSDDFFDDAKRDKYSLYRDFFKIIDSKPEMRIVKSFTREETNEEYEDRIRKEEEEQLAKMALMKKDPKSKLTQAAQAQSQAQALRKKKTDDTTGIGQQLIDKKQRHVPMPSNISMRNGYPLYCRWLASIFQVIKDRNILDVNTGETIWQKIYPQENGIPIYNPQGRYIVKLYYMGKHRQIEIDDTMPCSRYDEFYLPRCDSLTELWPAILTKAIIKLYSYTYISASYKECGDYTAFYSLTGLIPQTLHFDSLMTNKKMLICEGIELVKDALSDSNYLNRKTFLLCYRKEKEKEGVELEDNSNDDVIEQVRVKNDSNTNVGISSSSKRIKSIGKYKRQSTQLVGSTKSLIELKHLRAKNQLTSQLSNCVDDIELNTPFKQVFKKRDSSLYSKNRSIKILENKDIKDNEKDKDDGNTDDVTSKNTNANKKIGKTAHIGAIYQSSLKEGMEKYHNKIFIGILYDVIEYFDNKEFNMTRLKPIDFSDLKDMVKQLNTVYVFKQLSKEEKKVYIEKLKQIKQQQKTEKAKRIEALTLKGSSVQCFKINNNSVEEPKLYIAYTEEEIEMTKNCLLNNWDYPPVEYLDKAYEEIARYDPKSDIPSPPTINSKVGQSPSPNMDKKKTIRDKDSNKKLSPNVIIEESYGTPNPNAQKRASIDNMFDTTIKGNRTWNKEIYMQLISNNIDQYANDKKAVVREKGTWVDIVEFFNCFNNILLLSNPNVFKTNIDWDNNVYSTNEYLSIDKTKHVIHLTPPIPSDDSNQSDMSMSMSSYVIILFSANPDKLNRYRDIPYKINFELLSYDLSLGLGSGVTNESMPKKKASKTKLSLKSFLDTKQLKLNKSKEYFLMFNGGIFPCGFFLKLLTDFKYESMTYSNYLTQYSNYIKTSHRVEHPIIEQNVPYLLIRIQMTIEEDTMFYIITNQKDNYVLEYTQCILINNENRTKKKIGFDTNINVKSTEAKEYLIIIMVNAPFNVPDEAYDIEVLCNTASASVVPIDNIPVYDVYDYYIPNKHYVLFQEFVFAGDKTYAMMYIKIRRMVKGGKNEDELALGSGQGGNANVPLASIKSPIKDKDKDKGGNCHLNQYKEIPISDKIRMKIELFNKDKELISSFDFYNETILYNFLFEGSVLNEGNKGSNANKALKDKGSSSNANTIDANTKGNMPYLIKCYIDKTELPKLFSSSSSITDYSNLNGLGWLIRIYSSDTLGFCKDTTKEDQERSMINSWEVSEPGRSQRAQLSRRRFLLEKQKLSGYTLTEEDETFISNPRPKRVGFGGQGICLTEANANDKQTKGKANQAKTKGKNDKETAMQLQLLLQQQQQNNNQAQINMNKQLPIIDSHSSLYVKNFLFYAYRDRLLQYDSDISQSEKRLNTERETKEKSNQILSLFESSIQPVNPNEGEELFKTQLGAQTREIYQKVFTTRKEEEKSIRTLMEKREKIISNIASKQDKERRLNEILQAIQASNNPEDNKNTKIKFDINAYVLSYKDIIDNDVYKSELSMRVHGVISEKKEEIILAQLKKIANGKEKEFKQSANQHLEDIKTNRWSISYDVIDRLTALSNK